MATISSPTPGIADWKASWVSTAPVSPLVQAPETTIASPVIEQTTIVSKNVPIMPIRPLRTGLAVTPAAWAMPAVPRPASFEKMPRATP